MASRAEKRSGDNLMGETGDDMGRLQGTFLPKLVFMEKAVCDVVRTENFSEW